MSGVTEILKKKYNIHAKPGQKIKCPICHKKSFSIKADDNVGKCFKGTGYEGERINQVFADSYELDWSCLNTRFDLVLIDGCHHYKYVKRDTENAINFLNDNGVIVWHDYGQIRSLSRAVDSFAQKGELEVFAIRGTRLALGVKPAL